MHNQLCTWTSKTRAIPSLHRDSFLAKVSGLCPVLRQVTPTNFIAGPLVVMLGAAQSIISAFYNTICVARQIQNPRQSVNLDKLKINNSCTRIATDSKKLCAFTNICNSETGTTKLTRTV
jgi:hypothetical protein